MSINSDHTKQTQIANETVQFIGHTTLPKDKLDYFKNKDVDQIKSHIELTFPNTKELGTTELILNEGFYQNELKILGLFADFHPGFGLYGDGQCYVDHRTNEWVFEIGPEDRFSYLDGLKLFDFFFSNVLEYVETVWGKPHTSKPWVMELKRDLPLLKAKIAEAESRAI